MEGDVHQASGITARAMERLDCQQSVNTTPTVGRMAELENSLGVFRGRSVETPPEVRGLSHVAVARPLPCEYAELETGAQENVPQHPDACSAHHLPPVTNGTVAQTVEREKAAMDARRIPALRAAVVSASRGARGCGFDPRRFRSEEKRRG